MRLSPEKIRSTLNGCSRVELKVLGEIFKKPKKGKQSKPKRKRKKKSQEFWDKKKKEKFIINGKTVTHYVSRVCSCRVL